VVIAREEAISVFVFDKVDFSLETQIVIGFKQTNYDLVYNLVFTCRMLYKIVLTITSEIENVCPIVYLKCGLDSVANIR
jgi:hypothetical protein